MYGRGLQSVNISGRGYPCPPNRKREMVPPSVAGGSCCNPNELNAACCVRGDLNTQKKPPMKFPPEAVRSDKLLLSSASRRCDYQCDLQSRIRFRLCPLARTASAVQCSKCRTRDYRHKVSYS